VNHVFGPVYSRRLGKSLGIDLVPFKTCTQDCIYCQLGLTTCKTLQRDSFCSVSEIMDELNHKLKDVRADFITLAGSGEPTLHSELGTIVSEIKKITSIPVAVLTNGSLLFQPDVRRDLLEVDVVCPSLDAGNDYTFQKVNKPVSEITFETFINGLIQFRNEYPGQIWLEVFLIKGITDSEEEVIKIAQSAALIRPDRIHLNTITRPPADSSISGLTIQELEKFAPLFTPRAEVIAEYPAVSEISSPSQNTHLTADDILNVLQRHPCSLPELAFALNAPNDIIESMVKDLLDLHKIETFEIRGRKLFRYTPPK